MARGIRRMQIFDDDSDYQVFMTIMKHVFTKFDCILHAYCLMTNHFHLLLETDDVEIGKIMKQLLHDYSMYYNQKHRYKGHLFEGRYVSCLVEDDPYFMQTGRYIHLNPVKAHMVTAPEHYKWSSYRTILGMMDDGMTDRIKTLSYFKKDQIFYYREFIEDVAHKYITEENLIRKSVGEDELWLPW